MRLIDADALREKMYHEAFEKDSDMQKWDSGCWIRYKMFENAINDAPTIESQQWIPVTERLPDSDDVVLVCYKDGSISTNWVGVHNNIRKWVYDKEHVVAWMPLPEPPRFFC